MSLSLQSINTRMREHEENKGFTSHIMDTFEKIDATMKKNMEHKAKRKIVFDYSKDTIVSLVPEFITNFITGFIFGYMGMSLYRFAFIIAFRLMFLFLAIIETLGHKLLLSMKKQKQDSLMNSNNLKRD